MQKNESAFVKTLVRQIVGWLSEYAPEYARSHKPGATEAELRELESQLGISLPVPLRALLETVNGELSIGEYDTLSAQAVARIWKIGKRLLDDGTFASFEQHYEGRDIVKPGWWHPGLIPFAEDSGGNQICIDLDPGPRGKVGQIVWWEIHEGPFPGRTMSTLPDLLEIYWYNLESGKYNNPDDWESAGAMELTSPRLQKS